jgi:hypothetical protein
MKSGHTFELSPLTLGGARIKAGFHCHTVNSDGGMSPEDTVKHYRAKGYQCLGITDHRCVTPVSEFSDEGFLGLDSTENGGDPDIIGVGVASAVPVDLPLAEKAAALAAQGGFTIAAHPTYCGVLPEGYVNCPDLMALEIYNAYCDQAYANGLATELWDMVLGQGKRVWGVAGDDAHLNPEKGYYSDAGFGWVEIWAGELARESVLDALKQGFFFSTQGPTFECIEVEEGGIRIECSPVTEVRWRTFGHAGFVDHAEEGGAKRASALPERFKPNGFVRIELVDREGRKAWSNPFFVQG